MQEILIGRALPAPLRGSWSGATLRLMTEQDARQALLLQARERPAEDGDWPLSALLQGHAHGAGTGRGPSRRPVSHA